MRTPSDSELRNARANFRALLSGRTPECVWQAFFSVSPFVLSRSLPVRLESCDIVPLGRPGRREPDFVICPGSELSSPVHGLIELKPQHARILTAVRSDVLSLTRTAATAIRQLQVYDRQYDRHSPVSRCVSFSSRSHLFVVMGMQKELTDRSGFPDLALQIRELFPPDVRLLTYDELFNRFEAGVPHRSFILMPTALFPDAPTDAARSNPFDGAFPAVTRRQELHRRFGGCRFSGISPSSVTPNVFLFNRPNVSRDYNSFWSQDGCFHYAGANAESGRIAGPNRSVLEAAERGHALQLFDYARRGDVEYRGQFALDTANPYYWTDRPAWENGPVRPTLWFRLTPVCSPPSSPAASAQARR